MAGATVASPPCRPWSPVRPRGRRSPQCRDLVVRYGTTTAVDGLSFVGRAAGQVLALLGPNGAGKTSTVETLEGYRRATGGRCGSSGSTRWPTTRRGGARMGVMLQRGGVYPVHGAARVLRALRRLLRRPRGPRGAARPGRPGRGGRHAVAAAVGRRAAAAVAGAGPRGPARGGLPRRAHRRRRPRGPPAGAPGHRRAARPGRRVLLTTHELAEAERLADRRGHHRPRPGRGGGNRGRAGRGAADGSVRSPPGLASTRRRWPRPSAPAPP